MSQMGRGPMTLEESEVMLRRHVDHWDRHGFGLFAAEEKATGELIGRIGLAFHRHWPADPEVGWLIDHPYQGRGLATEGGAACIDYGFNELGIDRIVSICIESNLASRRVMEKLGLSLLTKKHDQELDLDLWVHAITR